MNTKNAILVIGGNGKTGRRVATNLTKSGWPVRIGSRTGNPVFDWHDAAGWPNALSGIGAVYITYQPDLAVPGAVKQIQQLAETAKKQGVQRLVLLSGRGEPEAQECEQVIIRSGIDYSIVRASWFCQNFSEGNFYEAVMAGHVALPAGDTREPFVDADDIAAVAVAALTEDGHNGKIYEVTGPRLLSFKQAVEEIAHATGREIQYQEVSMQEYAGEMEQYGLPPEIISLVRYLFTEVMDGRNEYIAHGVEQALGRKPIDFAAYAKKTTDSGIWNRQTVIQQP